MSMLKHNEIFENASLCKYFAHENIKKTLKSSILYVPNLFFSIANRPKIISNIIFCSIKMAPCATSK